VLSERLAMLAAEEAVGQSGLASDDFPGALFIAVPPVEMEWPQREALAEASGQDGDVTYKDLLKAAATGRFKPWHDLFIFGTVADRVADRFGTRGSPISLSTACSSGATAIQLGVEAIRRGETDAALCIGTDGSVNPESLMRFSLLSASRPRTTIGRRLEAVLEEPRRLRDGRGRRGARARERGISQGAGATILGYVLGCGEKGDGFHRTRSSPDGAPIIAAIKDALADADLSAEDIDYVNAHGTLDARERQDGIHGLHGRVRRAHGPCADLVQQVDDRPHAHRGGRGGGGCVPAHHREWPHPAHHQLRGARPRDSARRGAERGPRRRRHPHPVQLLRLRRPEYLPRARRGTEVSPASMTAKRVLVTGGAKGVGAAIVRALVEAGHDVDFTYRSSGDAAEALAAEIMGAYPERRVTARPLDLADKAALEAFCEAIEGEAFFGLVHNAGQPYDALAAVMAQDRPKPPCR
jgi:hypothetical protein